MRDRLVWIAVLVYAAIFSFLGAWKFDVHRNFVDFGIFTQTAASAFGCFCNTVEGSHWAFHFSPILYVAGVVLWVWHSSYAMVALQSLACALALPPLYGLVARRASRAVARLTLLVGFLYPALAGLAFNDFHENVFAPAAVLWMLWAFDGGYTIAALIFAAVALAVKEDQAIFLMAAGALGYLRFRGTAYGRAALIVAVAGALVLTFFFKDIQPLAASNAHWSPERFYSWTAPELRALVFGGILARLGFVVLAFLPLLFIPFRSRMMWLAALPLAEVLLSRMPSTFTMGSHYAGVWIGYVFAAFAFGIRRMPEMIARRALLGCAALCALEFLVANPLHPGMNLHRISARDRELDAYLRTLPRDMRVASQEEVYTHLALRDPYANVLPDDPATRVATPFVLIDRAYPDSPRLVEYGATIHPPCFVRVARTKSIELYRAVCLPSSN